MWSDAYIITIEENFDHIINRLYETEIIDKIFLEEESMIDKRDFMNKFNNPLKPINWLF